MEIDSGCKTRILVVDDEHLIANTLAAILNLSGFNACAVYSGEEAIMALESFKPDVVISDVPYSWMATKP